MNQDEQIRFKKWRLYVIVLVLLLIVVALIVRMIYLTVVEEHFLSEQGNARSLRIVAIPAYRGMILDRNGKPLAISTPVDSIWMNPKQFKPDPKNLVLLSNSLGLSQSAILKQDAKNQKRQFVYLKRGLPPEQAEQIKALDIPGIYLEKEYRRYYPDGAATAHIIGFTNIDDKGITGLEYAYNKPLQGVPGKQLIEQDRYGHTVSILKLLKAQRPGQNVEISIDQRIQFLAYRVLKDAVKKYQAESGSAVVLNVKTGEVLAMTNVPSYNPNNRPADTNGRYRNRAVTDVYEPGSVMKSFAIINALDSGQFTPDMKIDTHPGILYLGRHTVTDENVDHGILTVTQVLQKSSNVGITKMTLKLQPDSLYQTLRRFGFGQITGSGFPGERKGSLVNHRRWAPIMLATLAFGYGVSATPLQLARAYAAIANGGILLPVTFLKSNQPVATGTRAVSSDVAQETLKMLQSVVSKEGTGYLASVPGYQVAGKTGTAKIAKPGGYSHQHIATFVSIAPVSNPQLVVVVVIHKPHGKLYYAAYLAAPATAKIMAGALQVLNIAPDDIASYENNIDKPAHWVAPV